MASDRRFASLPADGPASTFNALVRAHLPKLRLKPLSQKAIPRLAKDRHALSAIARAIREIPTGHRFHLGDARTMAQLPDESVHLVVTSPPYFDLKKYPDNDAQLGGLHDYEVFLKELDRVWAECRRALAVRTPILRRFMTPSDGQAAGILNRSSVSQTHKRFGPSRQSTERRCHPGYFRLK
jgi:hypothetical protein